MQTKTHESIQKSKTYLSTMLLVAPLLLGAYAPIVHADTVEPQAVVESIKESTKESKESKEKANEEAVTKESKEKSTGESDSSDKDTNKVDESTKAPVVTSTIITTAADDAFHQLQATRDNLAQQIQVLVSSEDAGKAENQARIASMKVQRLNVESQIQVVVSKQEAEKAAKEKAEKEAKEKAEREAREAEERAAQQAAEQAAREAEEQAAQQAQQAQQQAQQTAQSQVQQTQTPAPAQPATVELSSDSRTALVQYAKTFIGVPYVWGGTTPDGFDCSGFTSYVYRHALGMEIGRNTYAQSDSGTHIALSELQPGDLIIEYGVGHVAMYIGDGMQIDAPTPGQSVSIREVPYSYGAMYGLRYNI